MTIYIRILYLKINEEICKRNSVSDSEKIIVLGTALMFKANTIL